MFEKYSRRKRDGGNRLKAILLFLILVVAALLSVPAFADSGSAADETAAIVLDGLFEDWADKPQLNDMEGETNPQHDIVSVRWFPDLTSSRLFLYCERRDGLLDGKNKDKPVDWLFQISFDNGLENMSAVVDYHPESEQVDVSLNDDEGRLIWRGKGKWGEDKYSANRVEFYIPLSYLTGSIETGFQFDMGFISQLDSAPDSGFITVSTAGTFPWFTAMLLVIWIAMVVFFHRHRMHFFKFITGSAGLFVFLMLLVSSVGEKLLEGAVTWCMWIISGISDSFSVYPGYSLITVYHALQAVSFIIDYECSGFIELLVYLCLLLFYPLFGLHKRIVYAVIGGIFIFVSNMVRLLFISYSISLFGTQVFFLSHTVFARILFFGLMILLYYYVFTRQHVRKQKVGDLSYD